MADELLYVYYSHDDDGFLTHSWPCDTVAVDGDDLLVDGYRLEDVTLERVETREQYMGEEIYQRYFGQRSLFDRVRAALGWSS